MSRPVSYTYSRPDYGKPITRTLTRSQAEARITELEQAQTVLIAIGAGSDAVMAIYEAERAAIRVALGEAV